MVFSQPPQDRLALLYRLSQTFNSSLDLDEVLNRVMDEVIATMHAERGFVMLCEADGSLSFRVARGLDQKTIEGEEFPISRSLVDRVVQEAQPILTSDAQMDDRFSIYRSVQLHGLRSILCVPMRFKDRVSGVIYVDNHFQVGIFTPEDMDLMVAIAASAATAIENARLYQLAVEKGRLERELQVAHQVQISLLPQEMPNIPNFEFAALWKPAREVAGDYYDFFPVGEGNLSVVVGDVSDKGMPAALFMASTRSIVRACLAQEANLDLAITQANQIICAESSRGMYVTLFALLLHPSGAEISYVNAGHNPPISYHAQRDELAILGRTGIALGVDEEASYEQGLLTMEVGDLLFLYTDGVTEAFDSQGREYGFDRLQQVIYSMHHASVRELISTLEHSLQNFTQSEVLSDDITMVAFKRLA